MMTVEGTTVAGKYMGVVMLCRPTFDKIVARAITEAVNGAPLEVVRYWGHPVCSPEQMLEWHDNGILSIDVGADKYHSQSGELRAGSATEFVVRIMGMERTEPVNELIKLMNENNRTGVLKKDHMSVVALVRELYKLPGANHADVIEMGGRVARAFVDAPRTQNPSRPDAGMEAAFPDLYVEVRKCNFAPFTIGRYMRDLWRLGVDAEEIRMRVSNLVVDWHAVQTEMSEAERRFDAMDHARQEFSVGKLRGFWLETDDEFITRPASKAYDILISKRASSGHMAVMTNKRNLSALGQVLRKQEPECYWYNQHAQGILLNGGVMYPDVKASSISILAMIELLRVYLPPRSVRRG